MVLVIDAQVAGVSGDMLLCGLVNIGANRSKIIDGIRIAESLCKDVKVKKIDFLEVKKNSLQATELLLDIDDDDTLSITNLFINKLNQDIGYVEILITNNNLSAKTNLNSNNAIKIMDFSEPYIQCSWLPENQYAYDIDDDKIKVDLKAHFKKSNSLTISQFKEISNTTRKLAVPLLEYLDKINFTFRSGNSRELIGNAND